MSGTSGPFFYPIELRNFFATKVFVDNVRKLYFRRDKNHSLLHKNMYKYKETDLFL